MKNDDEKLFPTDSRKTIVCGEPFARLVRIFFLRVRAWIASSKKER